MANDEAEGAPEIDGPEVEEPTAPSGPAAQAAAEPEQASIFGPDGELAIDEMDLTDEEESRLRSVVDEFGEEKLTEVVIDAAFSEDFAEFLLDAQPRMQEVMERQSGKADFYLHREIRADGDEFYVLKSPTPAEFNTRWTAMLDPNLGEDQYQRHLSSLLQTAMVYPSYDEVDWDYSGNGMYSPKGLTKNRLVNVFWKYELQDQNQPTDTVVNEEQVGDAVTVAERHVDDEKPSL